MGVCCSRFNFELTIVQDTLPEYNSGNFHPSDILYYLDIVELTLNSLLLCIRDRSSKGTEFQPQLVEKSSRVSSPPPFPPVTGLPTYQPPPEVCQFFIIFLALLHRVDLHYEDRFCIILGQILELPVIWFRSLQLSHELSLIPDALYSLVDKIYLMVYNMYLSIR
jgi:hypothetical protein